METLGSRRLKRVAWGVRTRRIVKEETTIMEGRSSYLSHPVKENLLRDPLCHIRTKFQDTCGRISEGAT